MNRSKIVFIYNEDYPWDIRVDKICSTAMAAGYEVHLVCNNKFERKSDELLKGLHIHRLRYFQHHFINTPIFFNPIWLTRIYNLVTELEPELIITRDLPLCLSGIALSRIFRIPTIFDMAENYPEAIKVWNTTGEYNFINKILRNYRLSKFVQKISVNNSDMIFVVTEESKEHLLQMGIRENRVKIIRNTPDFSFIKANLSESKTRQLRRHYKDQFLILYVGGFQFHRGINDAIEGMVDVSHIIPECKLILIGDGPWRATYEHIVGKMGLRNHVEFLGYIDFPNLFDYISISNLCIVPHRRSAHTDTTMPNKIFDYMAMGKPVLVSDALPLKRLVNEENCGDFFVSANPKHFAQKTIELYRSGKLKTMGLNAKHACKQKYNWSVDKRSLLESLEHFLG